MCRGNCIRRKAFSSTIDGRRDDEDTYANHDDSLRLFYIDMHSKTTTRPGDYSMTTFWPANPYPPGGVWDRQGVNFALFSQHAAGVELCLFDAADAPVEYE